MPLNELRPQLSIKDYKVDVHLGCSEEERQMAQEVLLSVDIQFFDSPQAQETDLLRQTVCYARVCEALKKLVTGRTFHLVEKLAFDSWRVLKAEFSGVLIQVEVHKVSPPVEDLRGGAHYCCGDSFV